jgi:hypothetical protein
MKAMKSILIVTLAALVSGCSADSWHHLAGYDKCDGITDQGQHDYCIESVKAKNRAAMGYLAGSMQNFGATVNRPGTWYNPVYVREAP